MQKVIERVVLIYQREVNIGMSEIIQSVGIFLLALVLFTIAQYVRAKRRQIELENKPAKEKLLLKTKIYTLEYGMGLKIVAVLCLIVGSLFWIINLGNILWGWGIGTGSDVFTLTGFSIMEILDLYVFSFTCIWRVKVNGDDIEYRNYFGIKKHYKLDDIFIVSKRDGEVVVYQFSNDKKIFTIGLLVKNTHVFLMHVMENSSKSL